MSEMVEKVARAICMAESDERGPAAYAPGSDPWNVLQRSSKRPYYAMARAAIEAMMEPSDRMILEGACEIAWVDAEGHNDAPLYDDYDPLTQADFRQKAKRSYIGMLRASLTEGE